MTNFNRISINPKVLNGKACIRGLRIPVHLVLDLLASGQTQDRILADYPDLEPPDIREAIAYASWLSREESSPLPSA